MVSLTISMTLSFPPAGWTWVVHDFIIVLQFDTICSWPSVPTHTENINTVIFHLTHNLSWFFSLVVCTCQNLMYNMEWLWSSSYFKVQAPCWGRIGLMLVAQIHLGLSSNPRNWDGYCHGDKVKTKPVIFLKKKVISFASSSYAWRAKRNFCPASTFDVPSLGRPVRSLHNPADINLWIRVS